MSDQNDTVNNESPREQMSRGIALVQDAFDAQYDEMKKELDHWKVEYAQQKHRANDAEKELKECKSRIAELEQQLEESKESHNSLFRKYYETKTEQEKLKQFKDVSCSEIVCHSKYLIFLLILYHRWVMNIVHYESSWQCQRFRHAQYLCA